MMNQRAIWAIIRKDLKVVIQSRMIMSTLIIVPLIMLVVLPLGLIWAASSLNTGDMMSDLVTFMANMPPSLEAELALFETDAQLAIGVMILYFFAPFFLILPLMTASVIAADSFAGEKDRRTLEALLYTPTSDGELYVAKLMGPWVAAIAVSWLGFIAYAVLVNVAAYPVMGRIFFPNLTWIILVLIVSPAAAGFGISIMVLVSSRVRGFQEAYQLGGMAVLPVVLLVISQAAGVIYLSPLVTLILGIVLWVVTIVLVLFGAKIFKRGELLARL